MKEGGEKEWVRVEGEWECRRGWRECGKESGSGREWWRVGVGEWEWERVMEIGRVSGGESVNIVIL